MNESPPKQTPGDMSDETLKGSNQLVTMYHAASSAGDDSFPVLKAFQDYIDAERAAARRRVIQLSVFFSLLMVVVVAGFMTAGIFMLRNMTAVQNKLLDIALTRQEPVIPPELLSARSSPEMEESLRKVSRATTELHASVDKKLGDVSDLTTKVHERVATQDQELELLRKTLHEMREQSDLMRKDLETAQEQHKEALAGQEAIAAAAAERAVEQSAKRTAEAAALIAAKERSAAEKADGASEKVDVVTTALPSTGKEPDAKTKALLFPPAVKDPPEPLEGVVPPKLPAGMAELQIPLQAKKTGTINWRVLLPE